MGETEYTVALDYDGTMQYGNQHVQYGGELKSYGTSRADALEAMVDSLGPWAEDYIEQMKKPGGTLEAMRACYDRLGTHHIDHGTAALNTCQQLPDQDTGAAGSMNVIET